MFNIEVTLKMYNRNYVIMKVYLVKDLKFQQLVVK